MTMNSSGPISLAGSTTGQSIALEIGQSATATISYQTTLVRTLSGTSSGSTVVMPTNFYGKSLAPVWNTAAGSLGSGYTQQAVSYTVSATNSPTYSVVSGALPSGLSLNTSSGVISGTISSGAVGNYSTTTVNFTIRATANSQSADRAFSIFVQSRYVGYSCATADEGGTVSATAPGSYIFIRVDFSSYGTPSGGCGGFYIDGCNSGSSNGYNPTPCKSYSVGATNDNWGDPCENVAKRMYIQMSYGPF
jgi:hypothetical protein